MYYQLRRFKNFNELAKYDNQLANELKKEIGQGEWQNRDLILFDTIKDLMIYHFFESKAKFNKKVEIEIKNTETFIDLEKMGYKMLESEENNMYWQSSENDLVASVKGFY